MSSGVDWSWKLREAIERLRTRFDHIGRKTGAPFLAIVYPPNAEAAVLKEWHTLIGTLGNEFKVHCVDVLKITTSVIEELGCNNIVQSISEPMPGSNPESELGNMWIDTVADAVRERSTQKGEKKPIVVLENVAALFPATGPRAVMQRLWDSGQNSLNGPVVVLIPGTLNEARVYSFLNKREEFMYRGDIL